MNGVRLHCMTAGEGPLVLLLHGFPDFSWVWRLQMLPLARAGFQVVAPDLRGFARSEKPRSVAAYDVSELAADVAALPRALGHPAARAIVGHDLGGVITWHVAAHHPEVAQRIAVLNAPHPGSWVRAIRSSDQLLRSAYVAFFQLPLLPELVLRAGQHRILLRTLRRGIRGPGALDAEDVARYRAAFSEPDALRSALNHYRALGRRVLRGRSIAPPRVMLPTLVIWGERDPFLSTKLLDHLPEDVERLQLVRLAGAGHWVQLDAPQQVNDALLRFLSQPSGRAASPSPVAEPSR